VKFTAKLISRIPQISATADRLIDEVVVAAAAQIQEVAQNSMLGNPPSAVGKPPAVRTGLLRGTISHARIGKHEAITFSPMEYAPHLEFGTVKMGARPFLRPATDRIKPSFTIAVQRAAQRA
jgi:hypothetical protein